MAIKSVVVFFTAIASLLVPNMAFSSNIHEYMTSAEIFDTFGTSAESIPEYQVFPFTSPKWRGKRDAAQEIKMSFVLNGTKVDLKLTPSGGNLASKYTPVFSAITDKKAYNGVRYEPLPNALRDIGEFKTYHDAAHEAAIVFYDHPKEGSLFEGVVTPHFAIRSLPSRLKNGQQAYEVINTPLFKRSIDNAGLKKGTSYFAVFRIPSPSKDAKRSIVNSPESHRVKRRRPPPPPRKVLPEAVYPEILLVLDHGAIRNHTITQLLRFILAFWNTADLVYKSLQRPSVRFNIAGFIIGADDTATPYLTTNASDPLIPDGFGILGRLGSNFYKEQDRFPFSHYDIVMGMTTALPCTEERDPCVGLLGAAVSDAACAQTNEYNHHAKSISSTAILRYQWNYEGVSTMVHEVAHLFGVRHDIGYQWGGNNDCDMDDGYIMTPAADLTRHGFTWSTCSRSYFSRFFQSDKSDCLNDKPLWMNVTGENLPGRWLPLDGQCRNSGMERGCEVPNMPLCLVKGCKAENSDKCVANQWQTLPGTKCGDHKICSSKNACVKE